MNGQERLFAALNGVEEPLLERSEALKRPRRSAWIARSIGLAACLAAVLLVWRIMPERTEAPPDEPDGPTVIGPEQDEPIKPTPPDEPWPAEEGEIHYLQFRTAAAEPEARFRIYINRESYYSYEEDGVYIIRPRQEPEGTPPCRLEITHLPDTGVKQAALLVQERLAGEYEKVEELLEPPNGWFRVEVGQAYLFASDGAEWDDAQREVWIQPDGEDGAFVLESSYFLEATEGHGARFVDMMCNFAPEANNPAGWTDEVTELREAGERLMAAVFAGDLSGVADLLTPDADVNGYGEDVSRYVSVASMDCSIRSESGIAVVSVKHRMGGEDSYTFLTIQLRREAGQEKDQWRAYFIGLEK